jgi:hypothetical protein
VKYDKGVGSLVLDADYFAELAEPAFEIILGCVFAEAFDVDLGISDSV